MTDFPDSQGPDVASIASATRTILLAELEAYEHLLFEPMTQADLDRLYALYATWCERLGDAPEAIALCDALDEFIEACIEDDGAGDDTIERAYLALVATCRVPDDQIAYRSYPLLAARELLQQFIRDPT